MIKQFSNLIHFATFFKKLKKSGKREVLYLPLFQAIMFFVLKVLVLKFLNG